MYYGYYALRSDGDGEFVMVIAGEEVSPLNDEDLENLLQFARETMNRNFGPDGWICNNGGDPDFPTILEIDKGDK